MTELTRLTCEEVFRRLDDYLDRELSAEETAKVEAHLRTCEVCAREYHFEASVLQEVRDKLGRIEAPETLRKSVLKLIDEETGN